MAKIEAAKKAPKPLEDYPEWKRPYIKAQRDAAAKMREEGKKHAEENAKRRQTEVKATWVIFRAFMDRLAVGDEQAKKCLEAVAASIQPKGDRTAEVVAADKQAVADIIKAYYKPKQG